MIEFQIGKEETALEVGESHRVDPRSCYRDAPQAKVAEVLTSMQNGIYWKDAVGQTFAEANPWLHTIVTHPSRSKFLEDKPPAPHDLVLDIGAGWGQTALPLARSNKVCALEPTPERLDFIQTAAKQEDVAGNLHFLGADYLEVNFHTRFDLILSIGVLEWVGAFRPDMKPEEAQEKFLNKTKMDLQPEGKLIIGIENRLGLKYLLGAKDDHIGLAGISFLEKALAKQKYKEATNKELRCLTHTLTEYEDMLKTAGYENINFYTAHPDYKLPQMIFPIKDVGCDFNNLILSGKWIDEQDGTDGKILPNQEELKSIYSSLAKMNIAHFFTPSFYIEAS